MATTKRPEIPREEEKTLPVNGNGGDEPTEAVFRVDLTTGKMRITDQKGDEIVEDPVPGKTRQVWHRG